MFQLSLRSLLLFTALVALAIVSLRFSTVGWRTLVIGIALVSLWAAAIVAIIDRGPRQAFAIGFALSLTTYAVVLYALPTIAQRDKYNPEFNADLGRLPTSRLLGRLYYLVADATWIDARTGQAVPNFDPATQGARPGSAFISASYSPELQIFMTIGHTWWAMLAGLCGGWFAEWIYRRRLSRGGSSAAASD